MRGEPRHSMSLDFGRMGAAFGYRETGDPFAGELGQPSLRTGILVPGAGAWLAGLLLRLGAALRAVAEVRGLRSVGR
jgi:hypothetical protein